MMFPVIELVDRYCIAKLKFENWYRWMSFRSKFNLNQTLSH